MLRSIFTKMHNRLIISAIAVHVSMINRSQPNELLAHKTYFIKLMQIEWKAIIGNAIMLFYISNLGIQWEVF